MKKLLYLLSALTACCLLFSIHPLAALASASSSVILTVDTRKSGAPLVNGLVVSGWTLSYKSIREVDIYIDGGFVGNATTGIYRHDVRLACPSYKNDYSGFLFSVPDISKYKSGRHTITVKSVDTSGAQSSQSYSVTEMSAEMHIDAPTVNQLCTGDVMVGGWALNASGVSHVYVYLDSMNRNLGDADLGGSRPDVNTALNKNGGYPDASHSGFNFMVSKYFLTLGQHTLYVKAIGKNGESTVASVTIKTSAVTSYNMALSTLISKEMADYPAMDVEINGKWQWRYAAVQKNSKGVSQQGYRTSINNSSSFVADSAQYQAIQASMTKYITPLNWLNDSTGKYMFLKLSYVSGVSASQLNSVLGGVLAGKGQVFLDAAKTYNVNPVYLAGHAYLETGNGTSTLAKGVNVNGTVYYNLFGINAVDASPIQSGSQYACTQGWSTVDKAIAGGAQWISKNYINNASYHQDTLYKMKWNPLNISHQYATDIAWAYNQLQDVKNCFDLFNADSAAVYDIPQFNGN